MDEWELDLPDAPFWGVYEELCAVLKADPNLSRAVKTWQTGTEGIGEGRQEIVAGCLPMIAIEPSPTPSAWETSASHASPFQVRVEVAVSDDGTFSPRNAWKLWHAVVRALFPEEDPALRLAIQKRFQDAARKGRQGYGSAMPTISQPGFFPAGLSGQNVECMVAVGTIEFNTRINT